MGDYLWFEQFVSGDTVLQVTPLRDQAAGHSSGRLESSKRNSTFGALAVMFSDFTNSQHCHITFYAIFIDSASNFVRTLVEFPVNASGQLALTGLSFGLTISSVGRLKGRWGRGLDKISAVSGMTLSVRKR
jgi:hypothetical protein